MRIITAFLINVLLFTSLAMSQDGRQLTQEKGSAKDEKRIALVIGNGSYKFVSRLGNPVNDASDIAATLRSIGFEVITGTDANLVQMRRLIRKFGERLEAGKGVGLFFYAGHGVEVRGRNFLVPVDADIVREVETEDYAVDLNTVLRQMDAANNGFNIVILDACRNNPFARGWSRSGDTGGLANVLAPTGTYIAYAAAPGSTASDGKGTRNGVFTRALLKNLKRPNLKLEEVFKATREEVMTLTANKQVPWDSSSVKGDFYFRKAKANTAPAKIEPVKDEILTAKDMVAIESEAWGYIKNSTEAQDFRDFLEDFPSGANVGNANIKLEQTAWDAVKDSKDKTKIQEYLTEFPSGTNVPLAMILLKQLDAPAITTPSNTGGNTSVNERATPGAVRKNSIGMELVYVPPGEFMMGSSEDDISESFNIALKDFKEVKRKEFDIEKPQHLVTIKDGFWMGKFEVTQGQWQVVMAGNPSRFTICGLNCPVEQVSWDEIQIFLRKLNQKDDGFEYSLPSEAQWEYAARAGKTGLWAGKLKEMGWFGINSSGKTHPVGDKKPNVFGLYDMHGNVWEWVKDIWNSSYDNLPADGKANESVGDSSSRVLRGGSWSVSGLYTRSANRYESSPGDRYGDFGFWVVARVK